MAEPQLKDAVSGVLDSAVERLNSRTYAGQGLEGIVSVIRGERARLHEIKDKVLWVNAASWAVVPEESTWIVDTIDIRLVLTAVVKQRSGPGAGATESQNYSMAAVWELMHDDAGEYDPTFGEDWIEDISAERGELSAGPTAEGLSGSAAQVIVRVRARRV